MALVRVVRLIAVRSVCGDRSGKDKYDKQLRMHGSSDVTCAHKRARARRTN
jgi:hypothetical protein